MKALVEGLLFVSGEDGLTLEELANITEENIDDIKNTIKELYEDYEKDDRGIQIEYLGNHYKLTTKSIHKKYYKKLVSNEEASPLTQSSLEVLAIIAYNSPITRVDIDNIRGVNSSYIVRKLLIKGLIEDVGYSDAPGRPKLYSITSKFLDYFGLGSLEELPKVSDNEEANDNLDNEKDIFLSKYTENN